MSKKNMSKKYSLGNYDIAAGYGLSGAPESSSFMNGSGLGFSLASDSSEGSNFMDSLNLSLGDSRYGDNFMDVYYRLDPSPDFLNNGDTTTSLLDNLGGISGITKGVGLASSIYSDYMQGKYLNAQMDALRSNMKMVKQANDTHYKNAAGFDSYSSSRTA